jgi:hypothetical protein
VKPKTNVEKKSIGTNRIGSRNVIQSNEGWLAVERQRTPSSFHTVTPRL